MTTQTIEEQVGRMYAGYPFPSRNEFGVAKMDQDFLANLEFLGFPPTRLQGLRVLDAGCGTGELSCLLARCGAQVTAIDISGPSLDYAHTQAETQRLRVEFLQGSLLEYPFPPDSFDFIVSHMVLHHTSSPERGVANLARALKPSGIFVIRVFQLWGRLSPFQKCPLWRVWFVRTVGGRTPEARVRFAERWVYRTGEEASHGLSKETYLFDNFGVPQVSHHTYGAILGWLTRNHLCYLSSNPPMEFARLVAPFLGSARASATTRGRWLRRLGQVGLTLFPVNRLRLMQRPTWLSRGCAQAALLVMGGASMVTVLSQKETAVGTFARDCRVVQTQSDRTNS